ncbi:MAG TPA: aminotransferase class I/II-fold pyridoxal phosphate-dependent enzyme [Candidatus Competibacteraceae bacterium]|nr:aminotransferase class I/II-fold pyridoxal phosphate-dependent enzyme [Candidatus Competibacteraceae bacterium]
MLDFTSALYLGLQHPSRALRPWSQLTLGKPAALAAPASQGRVAEALAELQGCERATLGPSTLHLFWDLFGMLANRGAIYMDAGVYPIARWGVERAAARGVPVRQFSHYDPQALEQRLKQDASGRLRPVVIADGFCPGCGKPAPIAAYLESARALGGCLVLDDTQALGLFGHSPGPDAPYGRGGGGSLCWGKIAGPEVLVVSSLAKGLGVPVAVLAGAKTTVDWFERRSKTRMHCSPPSIVAIHAAEHALAVNRKCGDALRLRLAQLVSRFRKRLARQGLSTIGGLFPVQTLAPLPNLDAGLLHQRLYQLGIRTVLHRARNGHGPRISFLITALHGPDDIDRAADALAYATRNAKAEVKIWGADHEIRTRSRGRAL